MKACLCLPFILWSIISNAQSLTIREVFDLHPGDKYSYFHRLPDGPEQYNFIKVIDRHDIGGDTIELTYFRAIWKYIILVGYERFTDTFKKTYSGLDKPIFYNFKLKDTIIYHNPKDSNYARIEFKDTSYTDSCGSTINYRIDDDYTGLSGTYLHDTFAIKGIGLFLHYLSDPGGGSVNEHFDRVTYYNKTSGISCGTASIYPLNTEIIKRNKVNCYPNPVNSILHVSGIDEGFYCIRNSLGQTISSGKIVKGEIQLNDLSAGNYIIDIITETGIQTQWLIKN